ncbi:Presequence protease, mitochondrial, partial [Kappamyces sp. JEL0680]
MSRFVKVAEKPLHYGVAHHWKHSRLGTEWIHVENTIQNNVFNIGFRTPGESTGISHILEHTTLCGSRKYPIRDPFFKMLTRSMATFMNAMTGDDLTMYPFSSQNETDYFNLMAVYLDSVFYPNLTKQDFLQEGWRLAPKDDHDKSLVFKGIVYNEMKGVMADTNNLFMTWNQSELFQGSLYGRVSGGDPQRITNLSWSQLKEYHATHYHPSNAVIYTFGNFGLARQMDAVSEKIDSFAPAAKTQLETIARWDKPRHVKRSGPVDLLGDPEKQSRTAVTWLVNQEKDVFESLVNRVLSDLLLDGASSPMHQELIQKAKLGSEFGPTTGYSLYTHPSTFSIGLQGVANEHGLAVQDRILDILEQTAAKGFSKERTAAVFHQIELGLKHRVAGFGMNLGYGVVRNHVHDGNPLDAMDFERTLEQVRKAVIHPGYLQQQLKSTLLDNPHRLTFEMVPDSSYPASVLDEEQQRLAAHVAALTEENKEEIDSQTKLLAQSHGSTSDVSCLPCLELKDVSVTPEHFPTDSETLRSGMDLTIRQTSTNGISYVTLKYDVTALDPKLLPYLPLFCRALTSLGTTSKSLSQFDEQVRLYTGGIGASCSAIADTADPEQVRLA